MWTDIDYMELRRVFTLDPERFPLERMRELVDYLHDHDQKYIVMVDPAVSTIGKLALIPDLYETRPNKYIDNPGYRRGVEQDIFLKTQNGGLYTGTTIYGYKMATKCLKMTLKRLLKWLLKWLQSGFKLASIAVC
jgi:alpha-glucosidase